jgi:hypothetical protein
MPATRDRELAPNSVGYSPFPGGHRRNHQKIWLLPPVGNLRDSILVPRGFDPNSLKIQLLLNCEVGAAVEPA